MSDWLEERTGYRAFVDAALAGSLPGGAKPRYVLGSLLLFLFANQVLTGTLLATGYAPSVHDAWASVAYTQEVATLGWFVRGMHSAGASAVIVALVLHLIQVTWAGAYRRPREVTWWVGLALLGVILAFALTGYLLPWDQKSYFATQVATNLLGGTPLVGPALQAIAQGGSSYGNLTLTRFYAMHVLVLPMVALSIIVVHVALFRRHGVTAPTSTVEERFYPGQLVLDLGACAIVALALVTIVVRTHGAPLEAPADPSSSYEARPEWYFLPLFQLLRSVPASLELVAAFGAPLVAGGALVALPFLSHRTGRALVATIVLVAIGLGVAAKREDARDAGFAKGRAQADEAARTARLRFRGKLGVALGTDDRRALAIATFDDQCAGCHVLDGRGEQHAPDLDGWSSRAWIDAFLANPDAPRFFGHTELHDMKPVKLAGEDRDALVEWIWSLGGSDGGDAAKIARGSTLFSDLGCGDCHERDGTSAGFGIPNLGGRASAAWLRELISDAGGPRHFGKKNAMPRFADTLSPTELDALVTLLRASR